MELIALGPNQPWPFKWRRSPVSGFSEPVDLTLEEIIMDNVTEIARCGGQAELLEIPEVHKRRVVDMWNRDLMTISDPMIPIGRSTFMGLKVIWTKGNRGIIVSDPSVPAR